MELAKIPERAAREAKAQAAKYGLDGPAIVDALSHMRKLLDLIAEAVRVEDYIGGACYSIADAAAIPYIWRLEMLRLFPLWADRPEISEWYRRMRERPSFAQAVDTWMRAADFARYADLADPWPKIREIVALQSGDPVNRSDHGYSKSGVKPTPAHLVDPAK